MQTNSRIGRSEAHALGAAIAVLGLVLAMAWFTDTGLTRLHGSADTAADLVHGLEQLRTSLAESVAAERTHALEPTETSSSALQTAIAATRTQLAQLPDEQRRGRELERIRPQLMRLLDRLLSGDAGLEGESVSYALITQGLGRALQLERDRLEQTELDRRVLARAAQWSESLGVACCAGLLLFLFTKLRRDSDGEKLAISEELLRTKADLERRVEQRTQDLQRANEELTRQIRERREAEAALEKSEQQLRQSQKLEAIGSLAGGVAHDFNNLLSVILSYGELLQRSLPQGSPMCAQAEEITRAGVRAADLTRQLLAFSRQQLLVPKDVDLNATLEGMRRMLQHVLGEDIELRMRADTNLYLVRVDPGQLEQVILNLIVNARDAMPRGGNLTIEARNLEGKLGEHPKLNAGPHVLLRVTDTGTGMDSAVQARIFEPFFTTKQQGKGTGLGLSTVHGIVQQSGGSVRVTSALGLGTTFYVYLPRAVGADTGPAATCQNAAAEGVHGHETVLLVEDDEQVRSLAQSVLERSGFRVIAACGGEEALSVDRSFSEPIQLLLTDVVMPRMSGRQLAEKLSVGRPCMKVLFMSGYTDDKVMQHGVFDSGIQFLHKPLTPDGLARKVREVLDAQS